MTRYAAMFERLAAGGEGAFVPFCVLGDPTPEATSRILSTLVDAGADALELGIPFSDPVADGPTIQAADVRALTAGMRPALAWTILSAFRREHPAVPVGLLVYANLVVARGMDDFYRQASDAGVDSVLVADVPTLEAPPFVDCAVAHGIDPVLIATPGASDRDLAAIASSSRGYTYLVTRRGVTGTETTADTAHEGLVARLRAHGAPPALMGFGIAEPAHVRAALAAGAAGAISGSAVVARIAQHPTNADACAAALGSFVEEMKAATRPGTT